MSRPRNTRSRMPEAVVMMSLFVLGALLMVLLAAPTGPQFHITVEAARATDGQDVRLYLYKDGNMSTDTPTSASGELVSIGNDEQVTFKTTVKLGKDIAVKGKDLGDGVNGLLANLPMASLSSAHVLISVKDGTQLVASGQIDSTQFLTQPVSIPFAGSWSSYTFHQGREIILTMNATVPTGTVGLTVENSQEWLSAYLELGCTQILVEDSTVRTLDVNGQATTSIYPNVPGSSRVLTVEGTFFDTLGSYDVAAVNVTILDTTHSPIHTASAVMVETSDWVAHYSYDWEYPTGLASGTYTVDVTASDNIGNTYQLETTIELSQYGVLLSVNKRSASGAPSTPVNFTVSVTNVGGSSDTISLSTATSPSSWTARIQPTSLSLAAGDHSTATLIVDVPADASDGLICNVTLTGRSSGSSSTHSELDVSVHATVGKDLELKARGSTDQNVEYSGVVVFHFDLVDHSGSGADYAVVVPETPAGGWDWELSGGVNATPGSYYLKNTAHLDPEESVQMTLTVIAPDSSTGTESVSVTVKAFPVSHPDNSVQIGTTTSLTAPSASLLSIIESQRTVMASEDRSAITVLAFEPVSFQPILHNTFPTGMNVNLSATTTTPGWSVTIDGNTGTYSMSLDANSQVPLTVLVHPARGASATVSGNGNSITLSASSTQVPHDELTLYVKIPKIFRINTTAVNSSVTVHEPGGKATFNVTLANTGNTETTVALSQSNDKGWAVTFFQTDYTIGTGGKRDIAVFVTTPKDTRDDDNCTITVTFTYGNGKTEKLVLKVRLEPRKNAISEFLYDNLYLTLAGGLFIIVLVILVGVAFAKKGSGQEKKEKNEERQDLTYLK